MKDLSQNEKRLIAENETLKIERDRKSLEHQTALNKEKGKFLAFIKFNIIFN